LLNNAMRNQNNLMRKLILEWLLVSIPFIYLGIKYRKWIFLLAVLVFLFTQVLRNRYIKNMSLKKRG